MLSDPTSSYGANDGGTVPVIRPNRSVWVLPSGRVVDVETEGRNKDDSVFSHGIFVKNWIAFRLEGFYPDVRETNLAGQIQRRARELLDLHPDLCQKLDADGFPNPYCGDLAFNQAAEEQGWVRIKPLTVPREKVIFAETFDQVTTAAQRVILEAAQLQGCQVEFLKGGALANRAVEVANRPKPPSVE